MQKAISIIATNSNLAPIGTEYPAEVLLPETSGTIDGTSYFLVDVPDAPEPEQGYALKAFYDKTAQAYVWVQRKDHVVPSDLEVEIEAIKQETRNMAPAINATVAAARKLIRVDELTADELAAMRNLYDPHTPGRAYADGDVLRHGDKLYEVIQAHTAQTDWTPDATPALFKVIEPPGVIPDFKQPTGTHDAYQIGDKVLYEGKVYESLINNNAYSPADYPSGWKLMP